MKTNILKIHIKTKLGSINEFLSKSGFSRSYWQSVVTGITPGSQKFWVNTKKILNLTQEELDECKKGCKK